MSALLPQLIWQSKRFLRRYVGLVVAALAGAIIIARLLVHPEHGPWISASLTTVYAALGWWRFGRVRETRLKTRDLELGALLMTLAQGVVQVSGGETSSFYPVMYIAAATVAVFLRPWAIVCSLALGMGIEVALRMTAPYFELEPSPWRALVMHTVFVGVFASLGALFVRAEVLRIRKHAEQRNAAQEERLRDETRLFRLVSAPMGRGSTESLFRSSVEEVRSSLSYSLELLKQTLDLHTCVILLLDDRREQLRVVEVATDSECIAGGAITVGTGAVGAVIARDSIMNLHNLRAGFSGLCYYAAPDGVRSFLGVPIHEHGRVIGALCADRKNGVEFTEGESAALCTAAKNVVRALENERVFVQLERSRREQDVLFRSSEALVSAMTEEAVIQAALSAAREIADFDLCAVTLFNPQSNKHSVVHVEGEGAARFEDLIFRTNHSLVAMAVKNGHYLPYRGEFDSRQQVVFTKRRNLRDMRSALVMPLIAQENALGTLVLAARPAKVFGEAKRQSLMALANQLAVALSNAMAVRRLEEMATTDGLTGCLNKRAFLEALEAKMKSAERFGRHLSLVVTDIDHFKSVNDTYGHATGDVVIKRLGYLLQELKRDTDIVARFGGEEFCILCEETDVEGALLVAERVRSALESEVFQSDSGELRVTCSLGVACFPNDADSEHGLFEAADQALYAAKHAGRNNVKAA